MAKTKLSVKYHHLSPKAILKLMEQGCTVEFPTGYALKGDISQRYIRLSFDDGVGRSGDGVWDMTLQGVKNAINDAKKYEQADLEAQDRIKNARIPIR